MYGRHGEKGRSGHARRIGEEGEAAKGFLKAGMLFKQFGEKIRLEGVHENDQDVLLTRKAKRRVQIGPPFQAGVLGIDNQRIGRGRGEPNVQDHQKVKADPRQPVQQKPEGDPGADQNGNLQIEIAVQGLEVPQLAVEQPEIQDDEVAVDPCRNGNIRDGESIDSQPDFVQPECRRHQVRGSEQENRAGDIEGLVQGKFETFRIAAVHARNVVQSKDRREQHARRQGQMKKRAAFPLSIHHGRVHIFPTYFAWGPTGDKKVVNILVSG